MLALVVQERRRVLVYICNNNAFVVGRRYIITILISLIQQENKRQIETPTKSRFRKDSVNKGGTYKITNAKRKGEGHGDFYVGHSRRSGIPITLAASLGKQLSNCPIRNYRVVLLLIKCKR